jgi:hypothetical protein
MSSPFEGADLKPMPQAGVYRHLKDAWRVASKVLLAAQCLMPRTWIQRFNATLKNK